MLTNPPKVATLVLLVLLLTSCATRSPYRYGIHVPTSNNTTTTGPAEFKNAENAEGNILVSSMTNIVAGYLILDGQMTADMSGVFARPVPYWRLSVSVANGSNDAFSFGPDNITVRYGDSRPIAIPTESEHLATRNRAAASSRYLTLLASNPLNAALGAISEAVERKRAADMSQEMFQTYLVPEVVAPGSRHGGYVYFPFGSSRRSVSFSLPKDLAKSPYLVAQVVVGEETHDLAFRIDLLSDDQEDHRRAE